MTPPAVSTDDFTSLCDLIEARCGLHFDESQRGSLSASVAARMRQLGLVEIGDYYERLRGSASASVDDEFRHLINLVTVTETCFFRDPSHFRLLRQHILPALFAGSPRTVRIWSAGCSTGEEAYSIALTLWDMGFYAAGDEWTFEIVGTDLNTDVLEAARRAVYSPRAVRNVPGDVLLRHFSREGDRFCLNSEIKRRVRFDHGNLMRAPRPCPSTDLQDLVFCKNVAIYFRPELTRRLVRDLHEALAPGGYLLLGHSESLWQMSDGFELVEHDRAYCYRKVDSRTITAKPDASVVSGFSRTVNISASDEYDQCLQAFRAGDWSNVEAALDRLIRSCPTFVPAHLLLGGVYAHRGRYDDALARAQSVLQLSELEPRAHLLLGMIASRRGNQDEAQQSLRRALYLDDSLALAHFWLGNLYRDRGDVERACHEYGNVVRDWERYTLDLPEEFASELSAEQIVASCRDSLHRLRPTTNDR